MALPEGLSQVVSEGLQAVTKHWQKLKRQMDREGRVREREAQAWLRQQTITPDEYQRGRLAGDGAGVPARQRQWHLACERAPDYVCGTPAHQRADPAATRFRLFHATLIAGFPRSTPGSHRWVGRCVRRAWAFQGAPHRVSIWARDVRSAELSPGLSAGPAVYAWSTHGPTRSQDERTSPALSLRAFHRERRLLPIARTGPDCGEV